MWRIRVIASFLAIVPIFVSSQSLRNAGFEEGSLNGWQFTNPAFYGMAKEAGYTCKILPLGSTGNFAVKLQNTGKGTWCQLRQKIAWHGGDELQKIRIELLMKTAGKHSGYVSIAIKPLIGEKALAFIETRQEGSTDWKTVSTEAIIPPQSDSLIVFCSFVGDGIAWLDQVSLTKLDGGIIQSPECKRYLDSAIHIIGEHAMYRDSVDFDGLVQDTRIICADARRPADCYDGIRYLLEGLGDHHSFLKIPQEAGSWRNNSQAKFEYPSGRIIEKKIGYLFVPAFSSGSKKLQERYADSLQNLIRRLDSKDIVGWIVDVRNNTGGNGFPMELGLGPVIGDGVSNRKIKNGIVVDSSGYWKGETRDAEGVILRARHPYSLIRPYPYVAVLTNGMTASSGEAVVLRFKHRPDTQIFGEPTYGNNSANTDYVLPDGAVIFVATHVQTDRLGNGYGGKLYPDVHINDDPKTTRDEILDAAVKWLFRNFQK